jgi:hypothetical protein
MNPGLNSIRYIVLASLVSSTLGHAQIVKWVDANGQTHYSEKKEADAAAAEAAELKLKAGTPAPQGVYGSGIKAREQFKPVASGAPAPRPAGNVTINATIIHTQTTRITITPGTQATRGVPEQRPDANEVRRINSNR